MNIRDLVGKDWKELQDLGFGSLSSVIKSQRGGYIVTFRDGTCVAAKGHDKPNELKIPRQAHSTDRIQRYGKFGTSI